MNSVQNLTDILPNNQDSEKVKVLQIMLGLISQDLSKETQEILQNQIKKLDQEETTQDDLLLNVQKLNSNDIIELHYSLMKFRKYISTDDDFGMKNKIQLILDLNIMKYLNDIIKVPNQDPIILYEAGWMIANIVSGSKKQLLQVLESNGVDLLVRVLKCEKLEVKENAVYAFGNLAGENSDIRDQLLKMGIIKEIIQVTLDSFKYWQKFNTLNVWALSNFCRGQRTPSFEDVCQSLDVFTKIISISDDLEVLQEACWALKSMSQDPRGISQIIQANIVPKLIQLLRIGPQVSIPSMMIIRDILTGDEEQINYILVQPIDFEILLSHPNRVFLRLVFEALVNIMAGSIQQIHRIIYNEKLIKLLMLIMNSQFRGFQKELAQIFTNALDTISLKDTQYLVEKGLIKGLSNLLILSDTDEQLSFVLIGINSLLEKGDEVENNLDNPFVEQFKVIHSFAYRIKQLLNNNQKFALQSKADDIWKHFIV